MTQILVLLAFVYLAGVTALYAFQRRVLYLPERGDLRPAAFGLAEAEKVTLRGADGVAVTAWRAAPREGWPVIVYFHGNAGHLGHRAAKLRAFLEQGFGLLALSYRGYGDSDGAPTEQGLYADARAALEYVMREENAAAPRIALYGESLGSGVAARMAAEYPVGMLALEAPYTSVAARAAELYWYAPVRLLIKDRFDSLAAMRDVRAPLLLLHGERDGVIPPAHGRAILAAAQGPKQGVFFPDVAHNDFDSHVLAAAMTRFAKTHGLVGTE